MVLKEYANKSVSHIRLLFSLDITQANTQWVNIGAGVWVVNKDALYSFVDSDLLGGFTAQDMTEVGSVYIDNVSIAPASTLLEASETQETFYWDGDNLYIHLYEHVAPFYHTILIGIVNGYSFGGFAPVGSNVFYESKLSELPAISMTRDPLFWGKLQYEGGSARLINGDGGFDTLGESENLYGNQARVLFGFDDLDIGSYATLFTGFVETFEADEEYAEISFIDKRKSLSKPITYACTNLNALDAIEEILLDNFNIPYTSVHYDTTEWATAKASALSVTINMQTEESAIEVIEDICQSTFGNFIVRPDGKYSFRIINPTDSATFNIPREDIINMPRLRYDPSEVITSTKVGYAKDWTLGESSAYTYLTDTSQEETIFGKYKTYNQKTFKTMLHDLTAAQTFSDTILTYAGTIRPTVEIEVSLKYYDMEIGDFCNAIIDRPNTTWMGERKYEVIGKKYNLDRNTISFTLRKYGDELVYRETSDGSIRATPDGYLRRVG